MVAASVAVPVMAQDDTRGTALVGQFLAAYNRTAAFTARLEVLTRYGEQESHMALRMHYARPSNIALTVLQAKEFPAANGTTLTWLGDRRARVSTQFYGLPLGITVPISDPRICNLRGYSIEDVSLAYEVPMLQDPSTKLRYMGSAAVGGHPAEGIEARSPRLLRGIERELIWLDSRTRFPLLREMYEAGRVVYRMAFLDYEFNPQIPSGMFARF